MSTTAMEGEICYILNPTIVAQHIECLVNKPNSPHTPIKEEESIKSTKIPKHLSRKQT